MLIIAGHSHTAALIGGGGPEDGIRLLPVEGRDRIFGLHERWVFGFPIRSEAYWGTLANHAPGNSIALLYGGNEHNIHFLFEEPPYFDLVPRGLGHLSVEADADIVPEALVRAKFHSLLAPPLRDLLTRLKTQAAFRIALVGTPPPERNIRHYDSLRSPERAKARLTSPIKMLKLWHLLQETLREEAATNGVEFISAPENAMDEDGYLKREFAGIDMSHANAAYGRVMLDRLAHALLFRRGR